jgi:hypothetical protein
VKAALRSIAKIVSNTDIHYERKLHPLQFN